MSFNGMRNRILLIPAILLSLVNGDLCSDSGYNNTPPVGNWQNGRCSNSSNFCEFMSVQYWPLRSCNWECSNYGLVCQSAWSEAANDQPCTHATSRSCSYDEDQTKICKCVPVSQSTQNSTAYPTPHPTPNPTLSPTPYVRPLLPGIQGYPTTLREIYTRNDYISLRVGFSGDTNKTSGDCSTFFPPTSLSKLGTNPFCGWNGRGNKMIVNLPHDHTLAINSSLTINGGLHIAKNDGAASPYPFSQVFPVMNTPYYPYDIAPVIEGKPSFLLCSDPVTFTAWGYPRVPGYRYTWSYDGPLDLSSIFPQVGLDSAQNVTIPLAHFDPSTAGANHTLTVTVNDWSGRQKTATKTFRVVHGNPAIVMPLNQVTTVKASQRINLKSTSVTTSCEGDTIIEAWRPVFNRPVDIPNSTGFPLSNTAVQIYGPPHRLVIRKNTLVMGANYGFVCNVTAINAFGQVTGSTDVYREFRVETEPVIARIEGSTHRIFSINPANVYDISFSAAGTVDPANVSMVPTLSWSINCNDGSSIQPTQSADPYVVSVSSGAFSANQACTLTLTAAGVTIKTTPRVATTNITIATTAVIIPSISVARIPSADKPDPNKRVSLKVSSYNMNANQLSYAWESVSGNFDLTVRSSLNTGTTGKRLGLKANALIPGATYVFKVTATSSNGATGTSMVSFTTNMPPSGGNCSVSPSSGTSLQTTFTVSCLGISDLDTPVQYIYRAFDQELKTDMCAYSEASSCASSLPAPRRASNNLTLSVTAKDSLGAKSEAYEMSLRVVQAVLDLANVNSQAANTASSGDVTGLSVLLSATTSYLSSNDSISKGEKRNARKNMLGNINTLLSGTATTAEEAVTAPLQMIKAVTDVNSADELDKDTRKQAVSLLKNLMSNSLNDFSDDVVSDSVGALNNVVGSLGGSANVSAEEKRELSKAVEDTLLSLGQGNLNNAEAGDDALEVKAGNVTLVAQKKEPSDLQGTSITSSSGANVQIPLVPLSSTSDVSVIVSIIDDQIYPVANENSSSTGLLSISMSQDDLTLNISGLSDPFDLSIPSNFEAKDSDFIVCRYWDATNGNWSTKGMTSGGVVGGKVVCKSTHLTAFSADLDLSIGVNTFTADDISADAFSFKNPVFYVTGSFVIFYVVLSVGMYFYDWHIKKVQGEKAVETFWRGFNRMRRLRVKEGSRSMSNFGMVTLWGIRRRHPWFSLLMRHPGDFIDSTKRVSILTVLLFNTMTVCALLLDQQQKLPGLSVVISTSIVAMIFAMPIPMFLVWAFKRSVPDHMAVPIRGKDSTASCFSWVVLLLGLCCGELMLEDMGGGDDDGDGGGGEAEEAQEDDQVADDDEKEEEDEQSDEEDGQDEDAAAFALGGGIALGAMMGNDGGFLKTTKKKKKKSAVPNMESKHKAAIIGYSADRDVREGALRQENLRRELLEISEISVGDSDTDYEPEPDTNYTTHHVINEVSGLSVMSANICESTPSSARSGTSSMLLPGATEPIMLNELSVGKGTETIAKKKKRFKKSKRSDMIITNALEKKIESLQSNHDWTTYDYIGLIGSAIIIMGCWFILSVLSWKLRHEYDNWWFSTALSFVQDIWYRVIQIVILEAICFLPCCWGGIIKEDLSGLRVVTFTAGYLGFSFYNTRVVEVEPGSPAGENKVRMGQKIVMVDGVKVETDKEIAEQLFIAHRTLDEFEIRFELVSLARGGRISLPNMVGFVKDSKTGTYSNQQGFVKDSNVSESSESSVVRGGDESLSQGPRQTRVAFGKFSGAKAEKKSGFNIPTTEKSGFNIPTTNKSGFNIPTTNKSSFDISMEDL